MLPEQQHTSSDGKRWRGRSGSVGSFQADGGSEGMDEITVAVELL